MDIKEIRESTGMNKKEFSEYFGIPYRTLQDWELGNRKAPNYVYNMIGKIIELTGMDKLNDEEVK